MTDKTITGLTEASSVAGTDLLLATVGGNSRKVAVATLFTGKQALWLPASWWEPLVTNGCGKSYAEVSTNKRIRRTIDFDTATQEFASLNLRMPERWNQGVLSFRYVWACTGGSSSQTVQMSLAALALRDGDTSDSAFGTAVGVSDTWQADTKTHISAVSGDVTPGGTVGSGCLLAFKLQRDVASDDLGVDAQLVGVVLYWMANAANDA